MVGEVEASINPDAVFIDCDVLLRVDGPLAGRRNPFALGALSANHGREGEERG
jgi:hypothetical protein